MDWFYEQISKSIPLTNDFINSLVHNTYYSGRLYKENDYILYGFLLKENDKRPMEMITFNIDELNTLYKVVESNAYDASYPILKLISK